MDVQSGVGGDIAPGSYHFATAFPRRVLEVSFSRGWLFAVGLGSVLHARWPISIGLCSGWVGLLPHSTFHLPVPRAGGECALTELCAGSCLGLDFRAFRQLPPCRLLPAAANSARRMLPAAH